MHNAAFYGEGHIILIPIIATAKLVKIRVNITALFIIAFAVVGKQNHLRHNIMHC